MSEIPIYTDIEEIRDIIESAWRVWGCIKFDPERDSERVKDAASRVFRDARRNGLIQFETPDVPYTDVCWEDGTVRLPFAVRVF